MSRTQALQRAQQVLDSGALAATLARRVRYACESEEPQSAPVLRAYLEEEMAGSLAPLGFRCRLHENSAAAALLPDVPAYADAQIPGASLVSWYAVAAPARTPDSVLGRLNRELAAVMAEPEVRRTLDNAGLEPVMLGPEPFRRLIRDEVGAFRAVAQRARISLD